MLHFVNTHSLRVLHTSDVEAYRLFRLKSLEETPLAFSDSYEDEIHKPLQNFVAELEVKGTPPESFVLGVFTTKGELIAFVKFHRDLRQKARHKAMVYNLYVAPEYRAQGLAKALMLLLLRMANSLTGLEQIHLWVLESDSSVAAFYESCGFKSQGTLVKKDLKIGDQYVDARYMVCYL